MLIADPSGSIVRWKPTNGWKQMSADGPLLRLCYKDLVAKLSCGVVGPKTFYSQRRQMTPDAIPTIVKVGCGCLTSRTDSALPADATSCCYGAHYPAARVYTVWQAREEGTLADAVSKLLLPYPTADILGRD